jgi:hypothetical protein
MTTFRIHTLPADALVRARAGGQEIERIVAEGGEPVRCCLRDATAGEELVLFSYQPPLPPSPYREFGAVLAHAEPCSGPASTTAYPSDWYGRPQVLRAYDSRGWIHDATRTHDGQDPEQVIVEMLAVPGVTQIHSRNIAWGCYMFTITAGPR